MWGGGGGGREKWGFRWKEKWRVQRFKRMALRALVAQQGREK